MKTLFLAIIFTLFAGAAAASMACGIQPLKPITCITGQWVCQCDGGGNCRWILTGC